MCVSAGDSLRPCVTCWCKTNICSNLPWNLPSDDQTERLMTARSKLRVFKMQTYRHSNMHCTPLPLVFYSYVIGPWEIIGHIIAEIIIMTVHCTATRWRVTTEAIAAVAYRGIYIMNTTSRVLWPQQDCLAARRIMTLTWDRPQTTKLRQHLYELLCPTTRFAFLLL